MTTTVYREHCYTARLVTARKRHRCSIRDHYPYPCLSAVQPGEQYVRSVAFPGHDAVGGTRPVVHVVCVNCAVNYIGLDRLAAEAQS
ncbi:MAG TPA: hypothetical protein VGE38_07485 [Nocardioides sp.]|uniref:hypothetical protein n=1 Tax=Nocardioides sp. TaxID=35761 RepID=UPI002EDB29DC